MSRGKTATPLRILLADDHVGIAVDLRQGVELLDGALQRIGAIKIIRTQVEVGEHALGHSEVARIVHGVHVHPAVEGGGEGSGVVTIASPTSVCLTRG